MENPTSRHTRRRPRSSNSRPVLEQIPIRRYLVPCQPDLYYHNQLPNYLLVPSSSLASRPLTSFLLTSVIQCVTLCSAVYRVLCQQSKERTNKHANKQKPGRGSRRPNSRLILRQIRCPAKGIVEKHHTRTRFTQGQRPSVRRSLPPPTRHRRIDARRINQKRTRRSVHPWQQRHIPDHNRKHE